MHNAVGMWFTFLALGVTYYALPKLLNRPIYSYALGVLGFWTNLEFYPSSGHTGGMRRSVLSLLIRSRK
jgi:cytochrome c oxidase cbb3-type subunit 1